MDQRSLDRFRKSLKEQRDNLHLRLTNAKKGSRPGAVDGKDEGDRASASTASEMSAAQQNQTENLLRAINGALDQIDNGSFGTCRNCGQEISVKRLEALPWARYCIACQELIDGR